MTVIRFIKTLNYQFKLSYNTSQLEESQRLKSNNYIPASSKHRKSNPSNLVKIKTVDGDNVTGEDIKSSFCLLNCRSVRNKTLEIHTFICDNNLDVLALTATWLSDNSDSAAICELVPPGYSFSHVTRGKRGGGDAIIYKSSIVASKLPCEKFNSFEYLDVNLFYSSKTIRCLIIYRSPTKSDQQFFEEFAPFLHQFTLTNNNFLILGDFNFHIDQKSNLSASRFRDLLDRHSVNQHINTPTHNRGHMLDLVITRADASILLDNFEIEDEIISDHFPIKFQLSIPRPECSTKYITFRKLKSLHEDVFIKELDTTKFSDINLLPDVNAKAKEYFSILYKTLDKLVPEKTKIFKLRSNSAWFNNEILEAKRAHNKAERIWRKTKLTIHKQIYKNQKITVISFMKLKRHFIQIKSIIVKISKRNCSRSQNPY
ncbi:hypothetical protein SNE40_019939 [Patella caerulea]|uniref:Endonuclease/exonuclease/phosphatase domain-containing protein n=1 Tax=Patella caerulea TaxID=87958 RepID=A0AAN8J4J0_PATCE